MSTRTIKTEYYNHNGTLMKSNLAGNPNSATMRCFNNMQMNSYGATSAQVFDVDTAQIYAEFKLHKDGSITTTYKYDPTNFLDPIRRTLSALFTERELSSIPTPKVA